MVMTMNELIVVQQLPIIVEHLENVKAAVEEQVKTATSLVCTEDTVKDVKKSRAELSNQFKTWEEQRKAVKQAIMQPYNDFESVYKDCITNTYKSADAALKAKIDDVESELKAKKEQEIKEYFAEYALSKQVDFVEYENARINVTLSASIKKLKEQVRSFIDRVCEDLSIIEMQEHSAEILVEYKQSLNVSAAIMNVTERLKAIEAERERRKLESEKKKEEPEKPAPEQVISAPKVVEEQEYTLTISVTATKAKLRELKAFLDEKGYKYE